MSDIRQNRSKRRITGKKDNGAPIYSWRDDNEEAVSSLDINDLQANDFDNNQNIQGKMTPQQLSNIIGDNFNGSGNPESNYNLAMQDIIDDIDENIEIPEISNGDYTVNIVDGRGEKGREDSTTVIYAVSEVKDDQGNSTFYKHTGYFNDATLSYEFSDYYGEPNIVEVKQEKLNPVIENTGEYTGEALEKIGGETLQDVISENSYYEYSHQEGHNVYTVRHISTFKDPENGEIYEHFTVKEDGDDHKNVRIPVHKYSPVEEEYYYGKYPEKLDIDNAEYFENRPNWKEVE